MELNYCEILDNLCVNTAVCTDPAFAEQMGWVLLPDGYGIGDSYRDGVWGKAPQPEPDAPSADDILNRRNLLLAETDWTQLTDAPLSPDIKKLFAEYRQLLRDISQQEGFPENVTWPLKPEE